MNNKAEEIGEVEIANNSTNIHFCSYDLKTLVVKSIIGGWSEGCIVLNQTKQYNALLEAIPLGKKVTLLIIKEG